jgi:hypothetical protein
MNGCYVLARLSNPRSALLLRSRLAHKVYGVRVSCFNPDTVRDHASYAFNSYYQKNPVQTSCDFGGTAVLTSTNPSKLL